MAIMILYIINNVGINVIYTIWIYMDRKQIKCRQERSSAYIYSIYIVA